MWLRHFSGLIIGVFLGIFDGLSFKSAAWVSDRWLGFTDRWLGWWVWWPLLAPTGLMVCVCVCGSVDGSVGSVRWVFFFFFSFCCDAGFFFFFNMGFCSAGILVSSGQWWLGFFWVFILMGLCVSHRC